MISAIVLAAGRSERMGTQKLLLPLAGKPMIARIVDELRISPVQEVIVVVGRDAERIRSALGSRAVTFATNPDFTGDMLSSIRCGLRVVPDECEAALIVLGDQPHINAELVGKLIAAFRESGHGIIVPAHDGHRGHPLLIATCFQEELRLGHDEFGLRGLLDAHPQEVFRLEVQDATRLEDMDTPADYQRHLNAALT